MEIFIFFNWAKTSGGGSWVVGRGSWAIAGDSVFRL